MMMTMTMMMMMMMMMMPLLSPQLDFIYLAATWLHKMTCKPD